MPDLLSIPPVARTVIYYILGVANILVVSAATVVDPADGRIRVASTAIPLLAALFLGIAASNVVRTAVVTKDEPAPLQPESEN